METKQDKPSDKVIDYKQWAFKKSITQVPKSQMECPDPNCPEDNCEFKH